MTEYHVVGSISKDAAEHVAVEDGRIKVHDEERGEVLIAAPNGGETA